MIQARAADSRVEPCGTQTEGGSRIIFSGAHCLCNADSSTPPSRLIFSRAPGEFRGHAPHAYFCICWVIWALCSWKRSLTRCCVAIHLRTQRLMQPFSRDDSALDVKSSTHELKQCSTRPPKAYASLS